MRRLAAALALGGLALSASAGHASPASGRNWQIAPLGLRCEGNQSFLVVGARLRYLGPAGLVEAPLTQLLDGAGKRYSPQSLVWKSGRREIAQWLVAGGVSRLAPGEVGEFEFKFDVRGAAPELMLEFGDVEGLSLTRKDKTGDAACEKLVAADRIPAPRPPAKESALAVQARVYRAAYPCVAQGALRTLEAKYPPYLPQQLLVFGRGYLPNVRRIALPMGEARAQAYSYEGPNDLDPVENAARRALGGFPRYASQLVAGGAGARGKYFLFNWGDEKAASGELHSIGVYELRACPR